MSALAQVEVGADGSVLVHNATAGPVEVRVDVSGWYSTSDPSNPEGGGFVPRDPTTALGWTSVTGGVETLVDVSAVLWNPSEITAVAVTVTAEGATADGAAKVWAASAGEPAEPVVVSYVAGSASSNTTVLAYDPTGDIRVEASSDAVVKVDVVGYWLGARRTTGYGYAPDALRLSKTQHSGATSFHWDRASGLPLLLEERTWWFVTRYVYGPGGLPLAQYRSGGVVELLHHDQLGSTRVVTSAADGSTVAAFTYDAWGSVAANSGSTGVVRHGYAGQYTDAETGLQYLRARYYDPATGQFLTRDPLVSLTREAYGYVYNSPLNGTDPTGLFCKWWSDDCDLTPVADFAGGTLNQLSLGLVESWIESQGVDLSSAEALGGGVLGNAILVPLYVTYPGAMATASSVSGAWTVTDRCLIDYSGRECAAATIAAVLSSGIPWVSEGAVRQGLLRYSTMTPQEVRALLGWLGNFGSAVREDDDC